jgi:hypothetical protein
MCFPVPPDRPPVNAAAGSRRPGTGDVVPGSWVERIARAEEIRAGGAAYGVVDAQTDADLRMIGGRQSLAGRVARWQDRPNSGGEYGIGIGSA